MTKINLSLQQRYIVDLDEGAYLVMASAGSGKTRVLTERIKRLSSKIDSKILAITFTNKAAAEIRERLGTIDDIHKRVFVGTFHSFCQSIIELRFKLLGYPKMPHIFEDDSDRIELIKQAIKTVPFFKEKFDELEPKKKSEYTYNALQFISAVKRELYSPDQLSQASGNNEYQFLFDTYQGILRSNNAIDFDDLIRLVYELFTNNESVVNLYRKAYSYVCIDECQDLNKLQYYLLKSLCGNVIKNIMMVGDPNQSIYGFNGSKSSFMQEDFVKDFQANEIYLQENYRCSRLVIEAANALMNLNVLTANYVINGVFNILSAANEEEEAEFVVAKIKELTNLRTHNDIEGEITYDKISILARNKFVFEKVEKYLIIAGIPYYYKFGYSGIKFCSSYMKIVDLYLRIKINPLDKLHEKKLQDILSVNNVQDPLELSSSNFPLSSTIKEYIGEATIENLHLKIAALKNLFRHAEMKDDEKKMTIDELNEFSQQFIQYKKQNLNPTIDGFKSAIALGLTNNFSKKEVGICLSTVHTMKGQESEIVFLIGMDDGTFPDYRAISKGGEDLKQELNNAYVAFTRAKRFLYVTFPLNRMMPWGDYKARSISRFLIPLSNEIH